MREWTMAVYPIEEWSTNTTERSYVARSMEELRPHHVQAVALLMAAASTVHTHTVIIPGVGAVTTFDHVGPLLELENWDA